MYEKQKEKIIEISLITNIPDDKKLNQAKVETYRKMIVNGLETPPIIVKKVTHGYWLKDGAHRIRAHKMVGLKKINGKVVYDNM